MLAINGLNTPSLPAGLPSTLRSPCPSHPSHTAPWRLMPEYSKVHRRPVCKKRPQPDTDRGGGDVDTNADQQRFTELYSRHRAAVERYVRRRVEPDEVADVVSDVFLTAWRRLEEIPHAKALPWLYGTARRALANAHRADRRRGNLVELLASQPWQHAHDHAESQSERIALARAFDALNDSDQEVLRLAAWEALPAREAAVVLGCSPATFHVRLHRARSRLRQRLVDLRTADQSDGFPSAQRTTRTSIGRADA
ncbi:sigma-70 family RNA polymerase sigma factor [Streptomyces sp. NPDC047461]|uniref:RNA polymerase sigma factor n=1 Tax=Streptomyces sp. NPDC047461 TaxID=3155619 RepID=UPI0033E7DAB0